jgi:hypothetical protein
MTTWEMRLNVYNNSLPGHANVSFYEDGEHQYTIGANILLETTKLAFPQTLPFMPDDGIYRDESAYHLAELVADTVTWASVPLPEITYDRLLEEARALENETDNYSLLTEACVDFVAEFYESTGHPGEFGDLFAEEDRFGSLVWMRVPVSSNSLPELWPMDQPFYVPSELIYVDKLETIEPPELDPLLSEFEGISPQKEWIGSDTLEFDFVDLEEGVAKGDDVVPIVKVEPVESPSTFPIESGPKPNETEAALQRDEAIFEAEPKIDSVEAAIKEDHFEFVSIETNDFKAEPSEYEAPPTTFDHKPSPPPAVVETSKPEPESVFIDPEQYGVF